MPLHPNDSPGFLLWHATLRWQRGIAQALAPLDLTHVQFVLLACTWWLNEQGERPTQIALAAQAGTDIKMTSQVVRSVERKRLLEREIDAADTRARRLHVTKRGAELAVRAIAIVEQVDSEFFADVPERQALSFLRRSRSGRARRAEPDPAGAEMTRPGGEAEMMRAVRLRAPGGLDALALEQVEVPHVGPGEALVRVHAAAITRDELEWPLDRLPAIPSYELSGVVAAVAKDVSDLSAGDPVWGLMGFDRDGAAAEYAAVAASFLAPKPRTLGHVESAAVPLAGLTAWQGLFEHGRLREGERVLIHGAAGGVGQFATQLARWRGAHVVGTSSTAAAEEILALGAHQALDRSAVRFEDAIDRVDLVFDTVGGEVLARSAAILREGGRIVSVVGEPPPALLEKAEAIYFVVEPSRDQLLELARLVDDGAIRPLIDSVYPLVEARSAFERLTIPGKRGKVVLKIVDARCDGR